MRRRLVVLLALLSTAVGLGALAAPTASAATTHGHVPTVTVTSLPAPTAGGVVKPMYAEGYTFFGSRTIAGHTIPSGFLDGTIDGSGLKVDDWKLAFESFSGPICNWQVGIVFRNTSNTLYYSHMMGVHSGCSWANEDIWYSHQYWLPGSSCATLYSNGVRVDAICESITL